MNIVIVGHVDHGKSTLVGRLLADTGVLGDGKLEKVQEVCRRQGKKFEYAFLLDALEAEQDQGITIDAARVFFRTDKRDYIIIDAPGHIEFLKNMVTGAARAEAAVLIIDANEGVQENSRRHGYLLSMLGIRQVVVAVNKMDLVNHDAAVFERIVAEYRAFLGEVGIEPMTFVPISARDGDLVAARSEPMGWFDGPTVLEAVDHFEKSPSRAALPLRMPVQDVYKFNERGDDRRIIAGRVEAGTLEVGQKVLFSPSGKVSTIASVEAFSADPKGRAEAGRTTGITLTEQIFVERGDIVSPVGEVPAVSTRLRANLFWLGREAMRPGKRYKLKIGTASTQCWIESITRVLDASDLATSADKGEVGRHDVAELILRTRTPIAFDVASDIEQTGRFVIVDNYDIAGGGIAREALDDEAQQGRLESSIRDLHWVRGAVSDEARSERNGHPASMVMFTGELGVGKHAIARALEAELYGSGHHVYMLDGRNLVLGDAADVDFDNRSELVRRFGEVAHLFLDAGMLVVSTTNVIGLGDHAAISARIAPRRMLIVHVGDEAPTEADMRFDAQVDPQQAVAEVIAVLRERGRLKPA